MSNSRGPGGIAGKPSGIKEHEEKRLNPVYTNLSEESDFEPIPGVTYIWAYTEKKDIVLGIEKPWEYPFAFNDFNSLMYVLKEMEETAKAQPIGHPTLTATFNQTGEVDLGEAFIAGELFYNNNNKIWCINNKSGRFHGVQDNEETIKSLMAEVKRKFEEKRINVEVKIFKPALYNPSTMWTKAAKHSDLRWESKNRYQIMLEGLRITIKHAINPNMNISESIKNKLTSLSKEIKKTVDQFEKRIPLSDNQIEEIKQHFKNASTVVNDFLSGNKVNELTHTDKAVLKAINDQINYFQNAAQNDAPFVSTSKKL